jgi:hypothetical protein
LDAGASRVKRRHEGSLYEESFTAKAAEGAKKGKSLTAKVAEDAKDSHSNE